MATLKELEIQIKEQGEQIKALTGKLASLQSAAGAKAQPARKAEKVVIPTEPVKVGSKKYLFTVPKVRTLKGEIVLTKAIVETPDSYTELLKFLVEKGGGTLRVYHQ